MYIKKAKPNKILDRKEIQENKNDSQKKNKVLIQTKEIIK